MIREVLIYVRQQQLVDHHSYPHPLQLRRLRLSGDEQLRLQLLRKLLRQQFWLQQLRLQQLWLQQLRMQLQLLLRLVRQRFAANRTRGETFGSCLRCTRMLQMTVIEYNVSEKNNL